MARLLFYVSGHGYGHATRVAALLAALREQDPELELHVRSEAPGWIFRERAPDATLHEAAADVGILQPNGLDLDLPATLAAHEDFVGGWDARLGREVAFLGEIAPDLVVADIPPLAFDAAQRAGVDAVGIANFSWDWILEEYAAGEPRWAPIVARYRAAYGRAALLYRLPLCGAFPAFPAVVDAPLLVNRSTRSRAACRRDRARDLEISPDDPRRLVLVSFGGFGGGRVRAPRAQDLSPYLFIGFGQAPAGLGADWRSLPHPSPVAHEELMRACDAILGKPGYGTVAEALSHGTRFLYVPREGFREIPALVAGLERFGSARCIPRADFEAGRWREHLDALFAEPPPRETLPDDGARVLARALRDRLAGGR